MPKDELFIILHNIRSALNVGAIFRTADAVGASKIFLCGYTPTPKVENPNYQIPPASPKASRGRANPKQIQNSKFQIQNSDKIAKTALGAEKWVSWERNAHTWRVLEKLKKDGVQIIALEQTPKSIDYRKLNSRFPMALMVGNEVSGLSDKILKYADKIIAIPMYGRKESLNVSVAFGVTVYSIIKAKK